MARAHREALHAERLEGSMKSNTARAFLAAIALIVSTGPATAQTRSSPPTVSVVGVQAAAFFSHEASILFSLNQYRGEDEIHLIRNPRGKLAAHYTLRYFRQGELALDIGVHEKTVFCVVDDVFYVAEFNYSANGCAVAAYNLPERKLLWRTRLQGIGVVQHSTYSNAVNLHVDKLRVTVVGHESLGDYTEVVDTATGTIVGSNARRNESR
jgi:hypothetical protein